MDIIPRSGWGARPPKDSSPTVVVELFLHHSVGSGQVDKDGDGDKGDDYMRAMQAFHMDGRGWDDIAYNHAYDPDGGEFYEGRGFGIRPGAQCRHNTGTHALVVMGDYRTRPVTEQMKSDIAGFYTWAIDRGHLPAVTVQGHRDAPVTGTCTGTTCPGAILYTALPEINALIGDDMLTDEEIRRIWAFPTLTAGVNAQLALTRTERGVNELLLRSQANAQAVADLIVADLGEDVAREVADEIAARLAE